MKKASNAKMLAVGLCGVLLMASTGCTSFNRDALWNACLDEDEYCTYYKEDFPVGSEFVHRQDDWTDYRLKNGYELKIMAVDGDEARLEHGWNALRKRDGKIVSVGNKTKEEVAKEDKNNKARFVQERVNIRPIVVKVLDKDNLKVGEFFKEYGQYKYEKDTSLGNGKVPYLVQENTCQDLVAEPYSFFYFRKDK